MPKIYYLEDEAFLAQVVVEALVSKGFEVKHDRVGSQALQSIKSFEPDICILDIMVPGISGIEVAKKISESHQQLPIIFLTAKNQTSDIVDGFNSGGNDYLTKPFSMEELIIRVQNLLKLSTVHSSFEAAPKEYSISGVCTFTPRRLKIQIKGKDIKLSHKENEILKLFFSHQNSVLSREDILMNVWNDNSYFNSRNLDVYVRKLRKLFAACPEVTIQTLRGVGYIFQITIS